MMRHEIRRGDVFLAHFGSVEGLEQGGRRPALVASANAYNEGASELVIVLPLTTRRTGIPSDLQIDSPEGGLDRTSFVRCDHIRSISRKRLLKKLGSISPAHQAVVDDWLRVLLSI